MNIDTILENEIKTLVNNKIEEKLSQQGLNLAKKLKQGPVSRVLDLVTNKIARYTIQQKIEWAQMLLARIGLPEADLIRHMGKFKTTAAKKAKEGEGGVGAAGADPAAAVVSKELQK